MAVKFKLNEAKIKFLMVLLIGTFNFGVKFDMLNLNICLVTLSLRFKNQTKIVTENFKHLKKLNRYKAKFC